MERYLRETGPLSMLELERCGMPIDRAAGALSRLEVRGAIHLFENKYWARATHKDAT